MQQIPPSFVLHHGSLHSTIMARFPYTLPPIPLAPPPQSSCRPLHFTPLHIPPPATFWGICWLYADWTLSHMNSHGDHTPCAHYFFGPMEPFTATALSYRQSTWPAVPSILCGWSGMQDIFFGFQRFLSLVILSRSQLVALSGGPNFSVSTGSPPDQVFLQACPTLGATPGSPPKRHFS